MAGTDAVRRIRWLFLVLGVVLLLPIGLLVQRAIEGVARERELSHRAIAERLFDEMERELSALLRAEEERPFEDYRVGSPVGAVGGRGFVDDSASDAGDRYVVGYFQIDPEGNFEAPPNVPAPRADRPASPGSSRQAKTEPTGDLEAIVKRALEGESGDADAVAPAKEKRAFAQPLRRQRIAADAMDRVNAASKRAEPDLADAAPAQEPEKPAQSEVSPYTALQSLNKGALARSDRQVKREVPAEAEARWRNALEESAVGVPEPAARSLAQSAGGAAPAVVAEEIEAGETGAVREYAASPSTVPGDEFAATDDAKREADRAPARDEIFAPIASAGANVEVYPMTGSLVDDTRLVLDRNVFVDGARYQQGLVVDVPALFRHLDRAAVEGSELVSFVARSFYTGDPPPIAGDGSGEFRFRHRFAEPFDALGVQLELTPLPDAGGSAYLTAIAVLLLVTGTGGLLALYRMVSVTVRFAERRNNFVAAVSHELKTPLTAIRMYAEMLRDGMVEDADKRREYYGTITAESERLTRLINNVLEFSRLEQGTREANLVAGSLGPVVREAAAILEPHARELGFRVEVEVDEDLPAVRFERDAVLQVVFNLVDNALKYAREAGDRVVAIRCMREGDGVCVSVRDRGPGVPAPHLSKIFEPFYRCEDELTRSAKGTGIGLALVRGLAATMGAVVTGRNLREGGFEVSLRFRPANG